MDDEIVVCVDTTFGSVPILLCDIELLNLLLSCMPWMLTRFFLEQKNKFACKVLQTMKTKLTLHPV